MKEKLYLQLFAEDSGAGAEAPATDTAENVIDEKKAAADQKQGAESTDSEKSKAKYTDADLDRILNKKFAKWKVEQENAVKEAKKLAEMDAEQKANYERDKAIEERDAAIKERDALQRAADLAEMSKVARKMLAESGINVSDELLSVMVTADAEETKAAIDGFTAAFNEAVENKVKDRLKGETPRTGPNIIKPISEIEKRIKKYQ